MYAGCNLHRNPCCKIANKRVIPRRFVAAISQANEVIRDQILLQQMSNANSSNQLGEFNKSERCDGGMEQLLHKLLGEVWEHVNVFFGIWVGGLR